MAAKGALRRLRPTSRRQKSPFGLKKLVLILGVIGLMLVLVALGLSAQYHKIRSASQCYMSQFPL